MAKCEACGSGVQIGAGQCIKPDGRNLRIVDHNAAEAVTIQAADIPDFLSAFAIADRERL